MTNDERLLGHFIKLVSIMAPSGKEKAVADTLIPELEKMGFIITIDDSAKITGSDTGNIIARLAPSEGRSGWRAFLAHMDSVPLSEPVQPVIKDEIISSLGDTILSADDRAGIAVIMEGLRVVLEKNLSHPGLEIIFTASEETGLLGAKALDMKNLKSDMAFVMDSSREPGAIIATAPFASTITWTVKGLAAHAGGAPEKGINAIQAASRGISSMNIGRIDEETTSNIGIIRGGQATNIVCDRVDIHAEARSIQEHKLREQIEHMRITMKESVTSYGATLDEKLEDKYPGFSLSGDIPVVKEARKALIASGLTPLITSTGGGSDANILNYRGLTTVNLGLGYQGAHTSNEHIEVKNLYTMGKVVVNLMTGLKD